MLIVGLALLIPSLVGLVALEKTADGPGEAALRQLVGAGVAVALLMYGLAIVYGATGTSDLAATRNLLPRGSGVLEGLGLALILVGLAYLIGAAPLHHWMVQVARHSQGAIAGSVIAMAGSAGGLTLVRVLVSGFSHSLRPWVVLAAVLAAIACAYPALLSLTATTVRGLVGLGACLQGGLPSPPWWDGDRDRREDQWRGERPPLRTGTFVLAVLTSFLAVARLDADGIGSRIADVRGLSRRSPLGATLLAAWAWPGWPGSLRWRDSSPAS